MSEDVFSTGDGLDEPEAGYDSAAVERIVQQVMDEDKTWVASSALDLASRIRWQPHALGIDGAKLLHCHFSDVIRPYLVQRLRAAHQAGLQVHVLLPLENLFEPDIAGILAEVDAQVYLYSNKKIHQAEHVVDALSREQVGLDPFTRTRIARAAWARKSVGTNHEKGRRLESLLAFLFEQVVDFKVVERNFRGDTDEIDLVVQLTQWSNRCWQGLSAPFVLVEAKNRQEPTGQPTVSLLIRRLQTKRGTARIGLVFTASTFTSDATLEVVKMAESNLTIALVGPDQITEWIESEKPDDYLEAIVRKAMLR